MSVGVTADHLKRAERLVEKARANGGLAPLDIERFWEDQAAAMADPFGKNIPQVPLGVLPTRECLFAELGVEEDWYRLYHDEKWEAELSKVYNDKSEKIIGRRLLNETAGDPSKRYPSTKALYDVFESKNLWSKESYWLHESAHNEDELKVLLDRVDARDVRGFILPANWEAEKKRLMAMGVKPPLYRMQRGPVTFAMSIYGVENMIYLMMDNPELAARFRDTILRVMLEMGQVLDEEAGYTPATAPRGFAFNDDNCSMLTPEMYEFFGVPILKAVISHYAPGPKDRRYQHSDSDMEHLLPILGRLGINHTNFGPKVMVRDIRRHLPDAIIDGELAPYTLMRNEEVNIVAEFLRDFEMAREQRGLVLATAGSINNGRNVILFEQPFPLVYQIPYFKKQGWAVIYDMIDDWSVYPDAPAYFSRTEPYLLRAADMITATSKTLYQKGLPYNKKTYLCPNAAEIDHFTKAREACERPKDLPAHQPRIGFFGIIREWFDVALLRYAALQRPGFEFCLIGGYSEEAFEQLKDLRNVHLLGERDYSVLPRYLHHFDVTIIPFVINDLVRSTNPIKVYEYLAGGKSVVATDIPEIENMPLVYPSKNPEEFVRNLDCALEASPDLTKVDAFLENQTWTKRFDVIAEAITDFIGSRRM